MSTTIPARFFQMLQEVWGFSELRQAQVQAIQAALEDRDALVVMPTGGGKSLCYQAPAVFRGGCTIVISPLIALMKDQVDGLRQVGVPAARWESNMSNQEKRALANELHQEKIRVFLLPPKGLCKKISRNSARATTCG